MKNFLFVVTLFTCGASAQAQFTLLAAETTAGSLGGNTSQYGGVQQYDFTGTGGSFTTGAGLPSSSLNDPIGGFYRGSDYYVANRHGNTIGLGSVQKFTWSGTSLTGGATILTQSRSSFQGFHGIAMAPNGDIFVTTLNGGTRRYQDSGSGYVDIGGVASGPTRDVWISPDGNKMIETTTGGSIRVTDVLANSFGSTTTFNVAGASSMHQIAFSGGELYVTAFNSNSVHKVTLGGTYTPTGSSLLFNTASALGVAFSLDGQEMFISGHTSNDIRRYMWNGSSCAFTTSISTGRNMGYLTTVPEPGTMTVLALGALTALVRRRRK